MISEVCMLW